MRDHPHRRQDMHSRASKCGPLPAKPDVHKLQTETNAYVEKARKLLGVQ